MARVQSDNGFNNLQYAVKRSGDAQIAEHYAARVPLGLNVFKGYSKTNEILSTATAKINGKRGDFKYEIQPIAHSRPYYGFDAKIDPTILNSTRKNFVDVSGRLIAAEDLPTKPNKNVSKHPLIVSNIIR